MQLTEQIIARRLTYVNILNEIESDQHGRYAPAMDGIAFGRNLERHRRAAGLNKKELAARAGMRDASLLTRYEQGEVANPGVDIVRRLAAALNVGTDALLAAHEPPLADELAQVRQEMAVIRTRLDAMARHLRDWPPDSSPISIGDGAILGGTAPPQSADAAAFAPVYALRVSADAGRQLIDDGAGEQPIGTAPYPVSAMISRADRVVAFQIEGDCLHPYIRAGEVAYVECLPGGDVWHDLDAAVNRAVFAEVGEAMHIKVLRRSGAGFTLTSTDGGPAIPVDDGVRIRGVVVWIGRQPRF